MDTSCDVAVIGAGPNGLSLAAHLKQRGVDFKIFGRPMETWDARMPRGMLLKSEGFATSLYDPGNTFSYARYCAQHGIPYAKIGTPPTLESFSAYGHAFQQQLVPELQDRLVTALDPGDGVGGGGYRLTLSDGSICTARRVVVAAGITHYASMPDALAGVSRDWVSHSADHHDLTPFKGKRVAVIGAGSSAADTAGLLCEQGTEVHLVCRDMISFYGRLPEDRPLKERLRTPFSPIGPGWRSWIFSNFAPLFRYLPVRKRLNIVRYHLGPAPAYFAKEMLIGRAYTHLGFQPQSATPKDGALELVLVNKKGGTRTLIVDHVICATGYKPGLTRLPFLKPDLISTIDKVEDTPVLSPHFQSSRPGLYFVGAIAAHTFGPLVRFACGAAFTAPRLAKHLARR